MLQKLYYLVFKCNKDDTSYGNGNFTICQKHCIIERIYLIVIEISNEEVHPVCTPQK